MTKHAGLGLKTQFWTNLALCWKSLKSAAPSVKMTKRGDLGLKTLFCTSYKLVHFAENRSQLVPSVQKWQNVLMLGWKSCFVQTRALSWKSLKRSVPSAKVTKRTNLGVKTLICTNLCTLLKTAIKCCAQCESDKTCWSRTGNALLYKLVYFAENRSWTRHLVGCQLNPDNRIIANVLLFLWVNMSLPGALKSTYHTWQKNADLGIKTLSCTNSCTLLKMAKKRCAQCETDKTCWSWAENAVLYFVKTRALCWKLLINPPRSVLPIKSK